MLPLDEMLVTALLGIDLSQSLSIAKQAIGIDIGIFTRPRFSTSEVMWLMYILTKNECKVTFFYRSIFTSSQNQDYTVKSDSPYYSLWRS